MAPLSKFASHFIAFWDAFFQGPKRQRSLFSITTKLTTSIGFAATLTYGPGAQAARYSGRITLGSYVSAESYSATSADTSPNDFATVSNRFFLNYADFGLSGVSLTTDVRDKHDFFDRLDKERLQLNASNAFQLRRLSATYDQSGRRFFTTFGRFPVQEAGATQTDGIESGVKITEMWRLAAFAGYNPKTLDTSYLTFQKDRTVFGLWTAYQPRFDFWKRYLRQSAAFVVEKYQSQTDRNYLYNSFVFQWSAPSQISAQAYVDFVPSSKMQNGNLSYNQEWVQGLTTTLSFSRIDVIEYARRQGLLETRSPSPYTEESLRVKGDLSNSLSLYSEVSSGLRSIDNLKRTEVSVGTVATRFLSRYLTAKLEGASRKNFASTDTLIRSEIGFFSNKWEFIFKVDAGVSQETGTDAMTVHPIELEVGTAYFISKQLYMTLNLQSARDERVKILSGFFKLGYRFGTQEVAPLRDGAPPIGSL